MVTDNHAVRVLRSRAADAKAVRCCAGVLLASIMSFLAADHHIDHIEIDNRYVNIHFNTLPNRTYVLQYRRSVSFTNAPGSPTTGWSNLTAVPALPFPNHYVISDVRTNQQQRYYRLRITP